MNAVIYARYSSDNQREESIDAQLRVCRKHCKDRGYTVIHEYTDEAFTATNDNRPAYQQMLKDCRKQVFEVAVFHKVNRNARNEYDYYMNKAKLMQSGVRIEYAGQAFDTTTAEGQLMENQLVGMAAYFSRNLAREVKKGQHENALKCVHNGGTPPLGYDVVDHHYVINESEAEAVHLIFDMYVNRRLYPEIVEECNRRGYHTKRGTPFRYNSLHDLLSNKKYAGFYVYGRTSGSKNSPRNTHKDSSDRIEIEGGMPAIISMDVWNNAQDILKGRVRKRGSLRAHINFYLSDYARCGVCGRPITGNAYHSAKVDKDYAYYRCSHRCVHQIDKYDLEDIVINTIRETLSTKKKIDTLVEGINAEIKKQFAKSANSISSIKKKMASIETSNNRLLDAIEKSGISDIVQARLAENQKTMGLLRQELGEAESAIIPKIDPKGIRELFAKWSKHDDPESIYAMLHAFLSSVTVYDDHIDIRLYISDKTYTSELLSHSVER